MSVKIVVTRVACDTGVGNQDITTAKLGGMTPVAAFFIVTNATSDGVAAADAVLGIGAATSSSERWAVGIQSEDAEANSDANRRGVTDECVLKLWGGNATVDGEADFSTFIVNGCTINWGDAPAAAYLLTVVFFAGTAVDAHASTFTMAAAQNGTTDVNTVGFEPGVLLTAGHAEKFDDVGAAAAFYSYGVVKNAAADEQYCIAWVSYDAQAASSVGAQITDNYGIAWCLNTGALALAGEFGSFDANGFSCTTRLAGAGDSEAVGYLALAFNGAVTFETGVIDSPVAVGDDMVTDPGFTPQYVHIGLTQMVAIDTAYGDANAGSIGISTFDASDAYCNSIQDEDAADPTNTQSLSNDQVIDFPDDDGTAAHTATFVGMESEGWTWNFSATEGTAVKWWYLAVEDQVPRIPAAYNTLLVY